MKAIARIDKNEDGSYDLLYCGEFSQHVESQTLHIRNREDGVYLIEKLTQELYGVYPVGG